MTIRTRLTTWYTLAMVVVLSIGAIAVSMVQKRQALERFDAELGRLLLTLEGVMRTELAEGLDLHASAAEARQEVVAPDRLLLLTNSNGALLAMWGATLTTDWRPLAAAGGLRTIDLGAASVRALSRTTTHAQHTFAATAVAPMSELDAAHTELLIALLVGGLAALTVAALGGWVVARQTLAPLGGMAAQAATITAKDLSTRLDVGQSGDEVGRFASAFNGLLDRLSAAVRAQRQFMADAAHELRTPVSVVRTAAQVTLARNGRLEADYQEALEIVAGQSDRLTRLVDSMFLLSRAEAEGLPLLPEPLYVDDVVTDCVRALRVVAEQKEVAVTASTDGDTAFTGDQTLLRQMVGNLLENAIRHAQPSGAVFASITRDADAITLRVLDDGHGVPETEKGRIFDRFVRLDRQSTGAGLGLPIARWVAEAHGGTLVLESTGPGGSCFCARLPV